MRNSRPMTLLVAILLMLPSLACGLSLGEQAEKVGQAVEQAGTAAAQAGDLAGTAAAVATRSSDVVATVIAAATPHVDLLKEKLAEIEPDAEGNYRVALSEEEVNAVLGLRQLVGEAATGAGLQGAQVSFEDGRITLSGNVAEPVAGQLLVTIRPFVEAGALRLDIESASVNGQEAPQVVRSAAESALTGTIGAALAGLPSGVVIEDVMAANDELIIIGRRSG